MNSTIESGDMKDTMDMRGNKVYEFYTDGGGNTGNGTWAFVNVADPKTVVMGFAPDTTNNRMELQAVIRAIESAEPGSKIDIKSDSGYVVNGFMDSRYLKTWMHNNRWKLSTGKPVMNRDLWERMVFLGMMYDIKLQLVPGHSGVKYNELCDAVCTWGLKHMDTDIKYKQSIQLPKGIGIIDIICLQQYCIEFKP